MNTMPRFTNRIAAKDNPFAVQRTDAIGFNFSNTSFENITSFAAHVRRSDFRGAICGKHGRGKTTLLCELATHLAGGNVDFELCFVPRETLERETVLGHVGRRGRAGAVILLDGIERIPFLQRQQLVSRSRRFGGFIATTHRPSRLRTLIHCRTNQQTLQSVLRSLDIHCPAILGTAGSLFQTHRGNLRFVLRDLYDLCSEGELSIASQSNDSLFESND